MKNKIIGSLLAVMAFSLVACGANKDTEVTNDNTDLVVAEETDLESEEGAMEETMDESEESADSNEESEDGFVAHSEIGAFEYQHVLEVFAENTDVWYAAPESEDYSYTVTDLSCTDTPVIIRISNVAPKNDTSFFMVDSSDNVFEVKFADEDIANLPNLADAACKLYYNPVSREYFILAYETVGSAENTSKIDISADGADYTLLYTTAKGTITDADGNEITADEAQIKLDETTDGCMGFTCAYAWTFGYEFSYSSDAIVDLLSDLYSSSILLSEDYTFEGDAE